MERLDYQQPDVARQYVQGRALSDEVLGRWGAAVAPLVGDRTGLRVLDLGAGTGIFARAWPRWRPCRVIALEPAAPMRDQMAGIGVPGEVDIVAGRGEALPLRDGSVDVAWLSTVIHHFPDLPRCASELRRVLTDGGVVLVRGLFAELGHPGGVELLPGWRRAVAAFPSTAAITATLSESGLRAIAAVEVRDVGPMTVGEAADRVRRLRHADSLLGQLTEDEIDAGLAAMDGSDPEHRLAPSTLGLLAFSAGAR